MECLHMKIMEVTLVIISIAFMTIGLKGLVEKKAFLLPAKWMWVLMLLLLGPEVFQSFCFLTEDRHIDLSLELLPLMFIVLLLLMWRQMSGYMAFGVTDDSFRAALQAALAARSIGYEERLSEIHLKEKNVDLQVSVSGYSGMARIWLVKGTNKELLGQIVSEMNKFFREGKIAVNLRTFHTDIVLGLTMLGMSLFLWHRF